LGPPLAVVYPERDPFMYRDGYAGGMRLWTVAEARAKFAALLSAAREGEPQTIRQSGLDDVEVTKVPTTPLNVDYLLTGRACYDAMWIVMHQYRDREEQIPLAHQHAVVTFMMPPNVSGDVVRWVLSERGAGRATWYVIDMVTTMRELQLLLGLPQTTAARVVRGLQLTSGDFELLPADVLNNVAAYARELWGPEAATEALGEDWSWVVENAPPREDDRARPLQPHPAYRQP